MPPGTAGNETLNVALRANAVFSAISATVLLLGSSTLSEILGAPRSVLLGVGVGLVLFVVDLLVTAARRPVPRKKAWYFVGLDVMWVMGSVVVLLVPTPLTTAGRLAVGGVALVVAALAAVQFHALRAAGSPDPSTDRPTPEAPAGTGS